jgi:hypothetical protein
MSPAPTPHPPPSEAEAHEHLAKVVELVAAGEWQRVCELGSGTCPDEVRDADPAAVPANRPIVLGSEAIQPTLRQDGASDLGGLVLRLCGRNGLDAPYHSEMLVFRDAGGRLVSINTLYWLGSRVARSPVVPAPTVDPVACLE